MPAETMSQNHEGKRIIYELETAIVNAKKLFLDTQVTKAIVDLMSSVLQVCVCLCVCCTCLYLLYCVCIRLSQAHNFPYFILKLVCMFDAQTHIGLVKHSIHGWLRV